MIQKNSKLKEKILILDSLSNRIKSLRKKGGKIILCHGVFDLLHLGHIKHLIKAKSLGETLVVSLTKDEFIHKGPIDHTLI